MGVTVRVESFEIESLRCANCGRPLWVHGEDTPKLCRSCDAARRDGREIKYDLALKCMCGNDAIIDYPMQVHTPGGSPVHYLEPLCYPCWRMETDDATI